MSYRVLIPKSVHKQINKLPSSVSESVISKLEALQENPRPAGSLKMHGSEGWRVRLGDYRLIFDIDDRQKLVVVRRVGHRREIYR